MYIRIYMHLCTRRTGRLLTQPPPSWSVAVSLPISLSLSLCPSPALLDRGLVFSTVTGKNGLGAFLSQEKGSNPFYQVQASLLQQCTTLSG